MQPDGSPLNEAGPSRARSGPNRCLTNSSAEASIVGSNPAAQPGRLSRSRGPGGPGDMAAWNTPLEEAGRPSPGGQGPPEDESRGVNPKARIRQGGRSPWRVAVLFLATAEPVWVASQLLWQYGGGLNLWALKNATKWLSPPCGGQFHGVVPTIGPTQAAKVRRRPVFPRQCRIPIRRIQGEQ